MTRSGLRRWVAAAWPRPQVAHLGVLGVVAFNLVVLRAERLPVHNLNDSGVHAQMVRWTLTRERAGHLPFDGWYPDLGLGSPHFHQYQSLSHIIAGTVANLFGATTTYQWSLYLLLSLWPVSVYAGVRLFGADRRVALGAAMCAPVLVSIPGYGAEHGSYTWQGYGLWSQLWGMALLPLAWGVAWRTVRTGRVRACGALLVASTLALHFLTGYQAVVGVAVFAAVGRWRDLPRRGVRAAILTGGALLIAAWVVVPLLGDATWINQSALDRRTTFTDSYGAGTILSWLLTGGLLDAHRLPVVTALTAVGLLVAAGRARHDEMLRAWLLLWSVLLGLYFGRATWGGMVNLLPAGGDLLFHRFILGFQVVSLFLAGVGLSALVRALHVVAGRLRLRPAVVMALPAAIVLGVLAPAYADLEHIDARGRAQIAAQRAYDATDGRDLAALVARAEDAGNGRIYAGLANGWGRDYRIGYVPVYSVLADLDADAVGFTLRTASLSTDVEPYFDETRPADYALFGVRWLLLPSDRRPSVPARLVDQRGRHRLYEVDGVGYLRAGDLSTVVAADRGSIAAEAVPYLRSDLPGRAIYPTVAYAGRPAQPPTLAEPVAPPGAAGVVPAEVDLPQEGRFVGTVTMKRSAAVVLASSYHPGWRAAVDGRAVDTFMVAPSLVAVRVAAGTHTVEFTFRPYQNYLVLWLVGVATVVALALPPPRRWSLRRSVRRWGSPATATATPDPEPGSVPSGPG